MVTNYFEQDIIHICNPRTWIEFKASMGYIMKALLNYMKTRGHIQKKRNTPEPSIRVAGCAWTGRH